MSSISFRQTPFSHAVFDLDGTLIDSLSAWENLGSDYLRDQGISPCPDIFSRMISMTLEEVSHFFREEYGVDKPAAEIHREINLRIADAYAHKIPFKPGAEAFLRAIKARGVRTAVATSNDRSLAVAALSRLNALELFDEIFTSSELNTSKRSPDIYLHATRALGGSLEDTLIFEDALYAVRTASQAGFRVVSVEEAAESADLAQIRSLSSFHISEWTAPESAALLALAEPAGE